MNGWTWKEDDMPPPARHITMEKADRGSLYTFKTDDGVNWTAVIRRANGHDLVTEHVTYEHMMTLKAIAEKPG